MRDDVERALHVSPYISKSVAIGMEPAERQISGLILGRVMYVRIETLYRMHLPNIFSPVAYAQYFRYL